MQGYFYWDVYGLRMSANEFQVINFHIPIEKVLSVAVMSETNGSYVNCNSCVSFYWCVRICP